MLGNGGVFAVAGVACMHGDTLALEEDLDGTAASICWRAKRCGTL